MTSKKKSVTVVLEEIIAKNCSDTDEDMLLDESDDASDENGEELPSQQVTATTSCAV